MEQDVTGLYYSSGRYQSPRLSRSISEIGPQTGGGSGGGTTGRASGPSGNSGSSFGFQSSPENTGVALGAGAVAGGIVSGIAAQTAYAAALAAPEVSAAAASAAASTAFSASWGLSLAPGAALGPAGWAAIAAIVVADVLLEVFDPFGSGTPWVNPKLFEPGHPIQWSLLGLDGGSISGQQRIVLIGDNGNVDPRPFQGQDNVCSAPGAAGTMMNSIPGVLRCCQQHDKCYTNNQCNSSSWKKTPPWGACNYCNFTAVGCIGFSIISIINGGL